jgi:hypothetical protein
MNAVLLAVLDLGVNAARLCRPSGVRVIAENLLLKQQLIVLQGMSHAESVGLDSFTNS